MSLAISSLGPSALEVEIQGRLHKDDYKELVPAVEERLEHSDKIALLVHVSDLVGWSPAGLWEDLKFDAKHYRDISRVAIVAKDDKKKWMATVSKPFTSGEVKFYPEGDISDARAWVRGEA